VSKYTPKIKKVDSKIGFFFLMLYTLSILVRPHEWSLNHSIEFPYIRILLILSFLFYFLQQKPKNFSVHTGCLFGIIIIVLLSGIRNSWMMGGVYSATGFVISVIIPSLLFTSLLYDEICIRKILASCLIASGVMLAHGYSQLNSPIGVGWSGEGLSQGSRISFLGIFNDPNDLGMYLLINIPFAFYFYNSCKNTAIKILMALMIFLLLWGIYKTNSRGSLVGVLSLMTVYGYFKYGKIKTMLIGGVSLPLVYIVMGMFRAIDSEEQSAGQRIEAWYTAIDLFKSHPFVGVGMKNFTEYHYLTAHNSYALVLAELGIIGYILWFVATVFPLYKLFEIMQNRLQVETKKQTLWDENFEQSKLLASALFYAMIGFLVTAFFISRSYSVIWMVIMSISMAHVFYIDNKYVTSEDIRRSNQTITRAVIIMSFFSLIAFYIIVRVLM